MAGIRSLLDCFRFQHVKDRFPEKERRTVRTGRVESRRVEHQAWAGSQIPTSVLSFNKT